MNYDVRACVPANLSAEDIGLCVSIITRGTAVDPESATTELPKARLVAIVREGAHIVGVGAIKRPRPQYASNVAKKSNFTFDRNTLELGYIAVEEAHRGHHLADSIVETLLYNYQGALFATTSNERMKRALKKAGFEQNGDEWKGRRNTLSLWIRANSI